MNALPLAEDQGDEYGTLFGVGLGPGDPDLMTLRAAQVIASVPVVAFHAAQHGHSIARGIAAAHLTHDHVEELLIYPVTTGGTDHPGGYDGALADFYTQCAERLAAHLEAGRDVAVLVAGDPSVYSSFQHLHRRLKDRFRVVVVPGVTSASAAAAALQQPLCEDTESLALLAGTDSDLPELVHQVDSAVIYKVGSNLGEVKQSLDLAGRLSEAWYVERVTQGGQRIRPLADVDEAPYFSLAVLPSRVAAQRSLEVAAGSRPEPAEGPRGEVVVVGLGPGPERWLTPAARAVLAWADDVVGYTTYVNRVPPRPGQHRHDSDNKVESERAEMALSLARRGRRVAVVSSGDPGVFAMASAVLEVAGEPEYADVPVRIEPGMTAAQAVASRVGAPLGHDFVTISLSDRLKPWAVVEDRLRVAAEGDFAMALYNPASGERRWQVERVQRVLLEYRAGTTPLVVGRAVGSPDESVTVTTLADFDPGVVDMRTMLLVGSSQTTVTPRAAGQVVWTPRRYP